MKKAIIILSCIVLILLGIIFLQLIFNNQNIKNIKNENDKKIEVYKQNQKQYENLKINYDNSIDILNKNIKELENKPKEIITKFITKEVIKYMDNEEKDKTLLGLQTDKINLNNQNDELKKRLSESLNLIYWLKYGYNNLFNDYNKELSDYENLNNQFKKIKYVSWGISLHESLIIDNKLNLDSITSLTFKKYFFKGSFYFGGGGTFKYSYNILNKENIYGAGINGEMGISIK